MPTQSFTQEELERTLTETQLAELRSLQRSAEERGLTAELSECGQYVITYGKGQRPLFQRKVEDALDPSRRDAD